MRSLRLLLVAATTAALVVAGWMGPAYAATITVTLTPTSTTVYINDDATADMSFSLSTPTAGTYDVTWWVEDDAGVDQASTGTATGLVFAADTAQTFDIDLTGLTAGSWFLRATLTGGSDSGMSDKAGGAFTVDSVAPHVTVTKVSGTFYPQRDAYLDFVTVRFTIDASGHLVVRNAQGTVVYTSPDSNSPIKWGGTTATSKFVPEGAYQLELVGNAGNVYESHYDAGTVTVSDKELVAKTFRRTVTPARSLIGKYVGKCSTLKRPSDRGWTGSFGLYTATKCKGTFKSTIIETDHAMRVPRAVMYKRLRISTYGGAARSRPGSYLFFDMLSNEPKWGSRDPRLGYDLGWHPGPLKPAPRYVFSDRRIVWGVYTYLGARYDVKSFKVELDYLTLV